MSISVSGFSQWKGLADSQGAAGRKEETPSQPEKPSGFRIFDEHHARLGWNADNRPQKLWGEIMSGGQTIARVYESGSIEYYGSTSLNIDPDASAAGIAGQIMAQTGGRLQLAPGRSNEMYL